MPMLFLGMLALVLALWALNVVSKVDPKIARAGDQGRRRPDGARHRDVSRPARRNRHRYPLGAFGLGLLGWLPFGVSGFGARTQKSAGQTSRVRSAYFEMELDHDSGAMRGRVLAGRHQGTALESLDVKTLVAMLPDIDEDSRALLMAYLDRREPGWREHAQGDAAAGRSAASSGKMTEQEAYQILGVEPGASAEDIPARTAR